jgi:ATP-dependent DNA ligase
MILCRDGAVVRLHSRNANDWTARLAAIAAAAEQIEAESFTIDAEAVVLGPDGLSRFEELRSKEAADTAILYPSDLIEHDGEDMRNRPFFDRKAALPRLLRNSAAGILFNEHIAEGGPIVFTRLGPEGIVSKKVNSSYRSGRFPIWIRVRYPTSVAVQRERSENWTKSSSAHSVHHAHPHTAILESGTDSRGQTDDVPSLRSATAIIRETHIPAGAAAY